MRVHRLRAALRLGVVSTVAAALVATTAPAQAASAGDPMIFGATAHSKSEILGHERVLGRKLVGIRSYKKWDSTLFNADSIWARDTGHIPFISVRSQRANGTVIGWSAIAAAKPGTRIHHEMVSQAKQLKAYRGKVYYAFNPEPEAIEHHGMGNGAQFAAAWRKIVQIHRSVGVTNVDYVWTMTAWGFNRTDRYAAKNYYPGDAYVDDIAADAYNWYKCRTSRGTWDSMASILEGHRKFGRQHPGKGLMLMEWGVVEDPQRPGRKAQWIRDMQAMFKKPEWSQYEAIMQWGGRNYTARHQNCRFDYVTSSTATAAFKAMGNDPAFTGTR